MVSIANAITASQYGRISQYFDARQLIALGFVGFGVSLLGVWSCFHAAIDRCDVALFRPGIPGS